MLQYIRSKIDEYIDDFAFKGKHSVKHILGKAGIKGSAHFSAGPLEGAFADGIFAGIVEKTLIGRVEKTQLPVIGKLLTNIGIHGAGKQAAVLVAGPVVSAFGVWMEQEEYKHRLEERLNHYRPEIAAWLGGDKRPEQLTQQDMENAAYGDPSRNIPGNPTLRNELYQVRLERNWSMGISIAANLTATAITAAGEDTITTRVAEWTAGLLGTSALPSMLGTIGGVLALGVVAYAVYVAVKTPLHWLAEQAFGVEKETVADKIEALRRGREEGQGITQAQVLDIYLTAHPNMDNHIHNTYGKHFVKLKDKQQQAVLAELSPRLNLAKLMEDMNEGRLRPEELAFAVHNQSSGVQEGPAAAMPPPESLFKKAWRKCAATFHRPSSPAAEPDCVVVAAASFDGADQMVLQAYQDATTGRQVSHAEMVGQRHGKDGNISWGKFVKQSYSTTEVSGPANALS